MKILAMYLPQFHPIPENDEWWGEGFTEWVNIKRENKYCGNIKPINNNYYNLLDKSTVEWQTKLAKEYGVYGFCYYHYWFKGKKLLEKPAENLLKWKDIDQKFCFSWANHDWNRSWNGTKEILLKQEYGTEKDWEEHFIYLNQFFQDERYIKIKNKPIFLIFNLIFQEKPEIIAYFDKRAKEVGFDGIYVIESVQSYEKLDCVSNNSDAILLRDPDFSLNIIRSNNNIAKRIFLRVKQTAKKSFISRHILEHYSGNKIMKLTQKTIKEFKYKKEIFYGAYSMWDNTYRHNERGFIISRPSKKMYYNYLNSLIKASEKQNSEFIFFNAWNEWAEGMIMEPDTKNGYFFLEGIKKIIAEK